MITLNTPTDWGMLIVILLLAIGTLCFLIGVWKGKKIVKELEAGE